MIPGKSDIPFTPDAGFYFANRLRKAGAHIYVFNGGFHHSKIMMVDDRFCTVGSTNLNSRSLRYDYEINAFIFDLPTTAELTEVFRQDKLNSTVYTREEHLKRSPETLRRMVCPSVYPCTLNPSGFKKMFRRFNEKPSLFYVKRRNIFSVLSLFIQRAGKV